jgi:hypothetical protein
MRKTLIVGLAWVAICGVSFAQSQLPSERNSGFGNGGGGLGQMPASAGTNPRNHQPDRPPPPPLRRCADLALASYTYVSAIPGQPALSADEIAIQWDVHNAGNAPYMASTAEDTSLALEYTSPSGSHQVAALAVPVATSGAVADHGVTLSQGQSWRGYMRATLPAEARRRMLRLRIAYGPPDALHPAAINDCDTGNNEVALARPPVLTPIVPAPAG